MPKIFVGVPTATTIVFPIRTIKGNERKSNEFFHHYRRYSFADEYLDRPTAANGVLRPLAIRMESGPSRMWWSDMRTFIFFSL